MVCFWCERRDLILVATTQSRALISALLHSSVSRGSDSHLGCHSTPLPFKSRFQSYTNTKDHPIGWSFVLVRETGLEPVRCEPHAPQTCASASSATLAYSIRRCSLATSLLYQSYFTLSTPFFSFFNFFQNKLP